MCELIIDHWWHLIVSPRKRHCYQCRTDNWVSLQNDSVSAPRNWITHHSYHGLGDAEISICCTFLLHIFYDSVVFLDICYLLVYIQVHKWAKWATMCGLVFWSYVGFWEIVQKQNQKIKRVYLKSAPHHVSYDHSGVCQCIEQFSTSSDVRYKVYMQWWR